MKTTSTEGSCYQNALKFTTKVNPLLPPLKECTVHVIIILCLCRHEVYKHNSTGYQRITTKQPIHAAVICDNQHCSYDYVYVDIKHISIITTDHYQTSHTAVICDILCTTSWCMVMPCNDIAGYPCISFYGCTL